jgi:hypothetical protein
MSALPPKADVEWQNSDVRFVPKAHLLNPDDGGLNVSIVHLPNGVCALGHRT